jgi:hypothetical protein
MALTAELETLLSKILDDSVREATRKQLVENQENGLRQADYSKKQNELKKDQEKLQAEWKSHVDWYNTAKDTYEKSLKDRETLETEVEELRKLKDNPNTTVVEELEIDKRIKTIQAQADATAKQNEKLIGTVSKIDEMIKDGRLMTADRFEEAVNKKADGLANVILDVWERQQAYQNEFGKALPRQTLVDEAAKHNGNLELAYESLTKADREAKLKKDIEADFEKKYQDKLKQAGLPIDSGDSPVGGKMGSLQKRALGIKETEIPEDVPADGSGRLGYLIAQELIKEGKNE